MRTMIAGFNAMFSLTLFLAMTATASAGGPPVAARLDVLSTPTLGGAGRAIWVAYPDAAAGSAVLSFTLESPGALPARTSQTLALAPRRLAEVEYAFVTPRPGSYRLTATLSAEDAGGNELIVTNALELKVAAPGKPFPAAAAPVITPLRVDSAEATADLLPWGEAWYSISITRKTWYLFLATPGDGVTGVHFFLYGPNNRTQVLTEEITLRGERLVHFKSLDPGTYYVHLHAARRTEQGRIGLAVKTAGTTLPRVTKVQLNAGAAEVFQSRVTIGTVCTGYPTSIMASERADFRGAVWQPYRGDLSFDLSPGPGIKKVYVKVRREPGLVSPVVSDSIELRAIVPLAADGSSLYFSLDRPGERDWYCFEATAESNYDIQCWGTTSRNTRISLFGPDSMTELTVADENWDALGIDRIVARLGPGKYYVMVDGQSTLSTGSYRIKLTGSAAPLITRFEFIPNFAQYDSTYQTYSRQIKLRVGVLGRTTGYRLSIFSDFRDAAWLAYHGESELTWTLPAGDGDKTVYFQVRDRDRGLLSAVVALGSLRLLEARPLSVGSALRGEITAAARADAFIVNITQEGDYLLEVVPDPALGGKWLQEFVLDAITGYFTISDQYTYFKHVRRAFKNVSKAQLGLKALKTGKILIEINTGYISAGAQYQGKYTIKLIRYTGPTPLASNFEIEYDGEYTTRRTVALDSDILGGTATHYMASTNKDFIGASWEPWYSYGAGFYLPAGSGRKTVYFKVKDAAGRQSAVVSDSIQLIEPITLALGLSQTKRHHDGQYPDIFQFTVSAPGKYIIETSAASSFSVQKLGYIYLNEASSSADVISATNVAGPPFPKVSAQLTAGTYQFTVDPSSNTPGSGDYLIRVYKDTSGL